MRRRLRGLHPDRRGDQPGQLGRPAGQPGRRGDRRSTRRSSPAARGNDGVGFAIPIDMAANVADSLIKDGKVIGRVGIALEPLYPGPGQAVRPRPQDQGRGGQQFLPGSPADKAGLKPGDVITAFNDNPVLSVPTFRLLVASTESGRETPLTYWHQGKSHTTTIVPAPADQVVFDMEKKPRKKAVTEIEYQEQAKTDKVEVAGFGLEVQPVTPELWPPSSDTPRIPRDCWSATSRKESPAAEQGIEPGKQIVEVPLRTSSTSRLPWPAHCRLPARPSRRRS